VRIAHVTDCYLPRLGGIEMQVADLAARQRLAGHEVDVITASPAARDEDADEAAGVIRLAAPLRHPHVLHPWLLRSGVRTVLTGGYDAVHVHVGIPSPLGFLAARAAARAGLPTVVTVHSMWTGVVVLFRLLAVVGGWARLPLVWTAVSEAAAGPVRRVLPAGRPVTVLPNGIDQGHWQAVPVAGDPQDVLVVGTMRLVRRKRPHALLHILRQVDRHRPAGVRLRAVLPGDGPRRAGLERYLRRNGMTDWVSLPGRLTRDELCELYRRADVFVAPAGLESFGIAALEARCAGLPVVAKRRGGVGELVRHGREGLLAGSDAQLTEALLRLVADSDLRHRIRDHNRTTPCRVSWAGVLQETGQAYLRAGALDPSSVQAVPAA